MDNGDHKEADITSKGNMSPSRYSNLANILKKKQDKSKSEQVALEQEGISTIDDLKDLKFILSDKKYGIGVPFNTNVMRIALNFQEEKIAR